MQRPPRPLPRTVTVVSPPGDQRDRAACHGMRVLPDLARERAVDLRHLARLAGDGIAEHRRMNAVRDEKLRRRLERLLRASRSRGSPLRGTPCSPGLGVSGISPFAPPREPLHHRLGRFYAVALQHVERVLERASGRARTARRRCASDRRPSRPRSPAPITGARLAAASRPPWIADRCLRTCSCPGSAHRSAAARA